MWSLVLVVNIAMMFSEPEYPLVWDTENNLALVIDDTQYKHLFDCEEQGQEYSSLNTGVISYQCRAEI